jgi:hypothetical protein
MLLAPAIFQEFAALSARGLKKAAAYQALGRENGLV